MPIEPLDTPDQDVHNEIARHRGDLEHLRSEICALETKLNPSTAGATDERGGSAGIPSWDFQLTARHNYLVTQLKSLSYVAAPSCIHSLPDDVLYRVLRLLHMSSATSPEDLLEWYDNLPLMLSTVCVRWQELVLSSPSLWRRVRLNSSVDESLEQLQLYLEISRDQPLTVVIESKTLGNLRKPALDILSAYTHQICVFQDLSDTDWSWELHGDSDIFHLIARPRPGQTTDLPLAVTVEGLDVNIPGTFGVMLVASK